MNGLEKLCGPFPHIMGIVNCTPDSFYPGSRSTGVDQAVERGLEMVSAGASILDIGGESSRPGSASISEEEELQRILPVIRGIRKKTDLPISVDTRKSGVARAALDAGADLINDITALNDDPELAPLIAERGVPVILMHMHGSPLTMQEDPQYDEPVVQVRRALAEAAERAMNAGVLRENIILDPGIGFGKRLDHNIALLKGLNRLKELDFPILIGLSRKSMLGDLTGRDVEARLASSIAAHSYCLMKGADILRVHDVSEAVDTVKIIRELL